MQSRMIGRKPDLLFEQTARKRKVPLLSGNARTKHRRVRMGTWLVEYQIEILLRICRPPDLMRHDSVGKQRRFMIRAD
jgi:hypothetical protein